MSDLRLLKAKVEFTADLTITEVEMRALDALVGYGDDAFLRAFKEKLGEAYIRDHEKGLRSFFETIRRDVLPALYEVSEMRTVMGKSLRDRREQQEARKGGTAR